MPRKRFVASWDEVPLFFDLAYAAMLFGFSLETLQRKAKKGEFPAKKMCGEYRVSKEEAKKYFDSL